MGLCRRLSLAVVGSTKGLYDMQGMGPLEIASLYHATGVWIMGTEALVVADVLLNAQWPPILFALRQTIF